MKKKIKGLIFLSMVLILVACGAEESSEEVTDISSDGGDSGSTETVNIIATNWDFDQDTYTVGAGEITINLSNEEGYHGIKIDGTDVEIDGDGSVTANLEPGEYRVWCSIPCGEGHDDMEATIVVE